MTDRAMWVSVSRTDRVNECDGLGSVELPRQSGYGVRRPLSDVRCAASPSAVAWTAPCAGYRAGGGLHAAAIIRCLIRARGHRSKPGIEWCRCTRMHIVEVSGVRSVYDETDTDDFVTLRFRVGQADESLATRGFTHLAEHLALRELREAHFPFNGATGQTLTTFTALGAPRRQAEFLNSVSAQLARIMDGSLPEEEILHEAEVLRAESAQRNPGPFGAVAAKLFGAAGFGLINWPEYGLMDPIDLDYFRRWTRERFCKENAVVAFHNAPDESVCFDPLPVGVAADAAVMQPIQSDLPVFVREHGPMALAAAIPRRPGAPALTSILTRQLTNELRHSMGASYSPSISFSPISRDAALVVGLIDIKPEQATAGAEAFLDQLTRLVDDGPTQEELDFQISAWRENKDLKGARSGMLEHNAEALIYGDPPETQESIERKWVEISLDTIQERAADLASSYLLSVPFAAEPDTNRIRALPEWTNDFPPPGAVYRYNTGRAPVGPLGEPRIVLSSSAVTLVNPSRRTVIIPRTEAQILLHWKDGKHQIHSTSGKALMIDPGRWQEPRSLVAELRSWFAPTEIKQMGFRASDPDAWHLPKNLSRLTSSTSHPIEQQVHILDSANWHFQDPHFGFERVANQAYVQGGLMLGWLADRMLLAPWVEASAAEPLAKYRASEIDRIGLYQAVEGLLATDMVVRDAKRFLAWLYSPRKANTKVAHIYKSLQPSSPHNNIYDLTLTSEVGLRFDNAITQILRREYAQFGGPAHQLKKLIRQRAKTPPPPQPTIAGVSYPRPKATLTAE